MGCGGFAVLPTWLSGCTAWYNPFDIASLTVDAAYTGANRFTDGDMEAVGTAAWSPYDANCQLTKEAVGPHGGTQWLKAERITSSGTLLYSQAALMTANRVYYYNGWMRGDGVRAPTFYLAPSAPTASVAYTSAVDWQERTLVATAVNTYANLGTGAGSAVGVFCGADDLTLVKLPSVTQMDDLSGTGNHATQGLGANNPASYQIGDSSLWFSAAQAAKEKYLTGAVQNAAAGTIWFHYWLDAAPGVNQGLIGSSDGVNDCSCRVSSSGRLETRLGSLVTLSTGIANFGAWNFGCMTWNGTKQTLNLNGALQVMANTGTASTRAIALGARDAAGSYSYFTGRLGQCGTYNRALSYQEQELLREGTAP